MASLQATFHRSDFARKGTYEIRKVGGPRENPDQCCGSALARISAHKGREAAVETLSDVTVGTSSN